MTSIPNIPEGLEEALRAPHPRAALQRLIVVWLDQGAERDDLLAPLEAYRQKLNETGRADDADLIAELVEGFDGWCGR